jgi:catechol 2,3-dioxygenase-like lactoylglutathione lyase family enzyme
VEAVSPRLVPELLVDDLQASLNFYCGLAGFRIKYDRPEDGFAYLERDAAEIMLEQLNPTLRQWHTGELASPFGRGINFQIEIDGLDSVLSSLRGAGWPLFLDLEQKAYRVRDKEETQRQFIVQDPDGYLLRFCESVVTS